MFRHLFAPLVGCGILLLAGCIQTEQPICLPEECLDPVQDGIGDSLLMPSDGLSIPSENISALADDRLGHLFCEEGKVIINEVSIWEDHGRGEKGEAHRLVDCAGQRYLFHVECFEKNAEGRYPAERIYHLNRMEAVRWLRPLDPRHMKDAIGYAWFAVKEQPATLKDYDATIQAQLATMARLGITLRILEDTDEHLVQGTAAALRAMLGAHPEMIRNSDDPGLGLVPYDAERIAALRERFATMRIAALQEEAAGLPPGCSGTSRYFGNLRALATVRHLSQPAAAFLAAVEAQPAFAHMTAAAGRVAMIGSSDVLDLVGRTLLREMYADRTIQHVQQMDWRIDGAGNCDLRLEVVSRRSGNTDDGRTWFDLRIDLAGTVRRLTFVGQAPDLLVRSGELTPATVTELVGLVQQALAGQGQGGLR